MSNRAWRLLLGGLVAACLGLGAAVAGTAAADPITCPPSQVSEKVDGQFQCVNGGGNTSNADETRNPND
jgi:hypothetical protein